MLAVSIALLTSKGTFPCPQAAIIAVTAIWSASRIWLAVSTPEKHQFGTYSVHLASRTTPYTSVHVNCGWSLSLHPKPGLKPSVLHLLNQKHGKLPVLAAFLVDFRNKCRSLLGFYHPTSKHQMFNNSTAFPLGSTRWATDSRAHAQESDPMVGTAAL